MYSFYEYVEKHPQFNRATFDNDFALLKLEQRLTFSDKIKKVELANHDDKINPGDLCWLVGWGALYGDSRQVKTIHYGNIAQTDLLHKLLVQIYDNSFCNKIYKDQWTENMICAGHDNQSKGQCNGDAGGPLICHNKLFGILSFGKENKECGRHPDVYGRVKKVRKWIKEKTGINS
ncbi:trypsin-2-like [Sitodiplosis mosellana]|uniref:trypsin-2-like n=1 Tax=Sitodiplosis mosellana TaxID=263140 RepID=UPI002443F615|nr:trypsin-2-like [Sitodiplosis mosellana]